MSNSNNQSRGGLGFLNILALIFITLKLTKVIDWSWWWVLSPLIAEAGIVVVVIVIVGVVLMCRR
jgi:uncharacterized membrane protein YdbT with pleckstrin-like domain